MTTFYLNEDTVLKSLCPSVGQIHKNQIMLIKIILKNKDMKALLDHPAVSSSQNPVTSEVHIYVLN